MWTVNVFSFEIVPSYIKIKCETLENNSQDGPTRRRSHVLEYKVQPNSQQYDVHTLTIFMLVRVTRFTATDAGAQWGSVRTYGNLTSL
jgi:hypothetical protein